jgi:leader peptidase (prepilin peptidase)/N-methyltransferase
VELLTAGLFLGCLWRFGLSPALLSALALVTFLIPLTFIDLEHWLLPFELTLPGLFAGLFLSLLGGQARLRDAVLGATVSFVGFWALEHVGRKVFQKEALGAGDKYLLAVIGAFLTYRPLLGVVLLSSLQGSVVGLLLLAVRGRAGPAPKEVGPAEKENENDDDHEHEDANVDDDDGWRPGPTNLPFGPWLSLAALEVLLLGPQLGRWLSPNVSFLLFGSTETP